MLVVKVQVFDKAGGRVKDYEVTGESGMTTMHYHDSGKVRFQLNKKGDYLFPVDVVMPGDWQVTLRLGKGGKELYAGKILFNV
jgi:nitrogen fixation protein FixH